MTPEAKTLPAGHMPQTKLATHHAPAATILGGEATRSNTLPIEVGWISKVS